MLTYCPVEATYVVDNDITCMLFFMCAALVISGNLGYKKMHRYFTFQNILHLFLIFEIKDFLLQTGGAWSEKVSF